MQKMKAKDMTNQSGIMDTLQVVTTGMIILVWILMVMVLEIYHIMYQVGQT